ncbi:MAG: response regulator transcription factor [bacterium]
MKKILVIEDEPAMRRGLKHNLELEGYEVRTIADGEAGLRSIVSQPFDLAILDIMLPRMSGFDLCKAARAQGVKIPILMLTAKGEEVDKIIGLELGADDYVIKPFSLRELLARVKALIRRSEGTFSADPERVSLGSVEINFREYTAQRDGIPLTMTPKEIEVLRYLWLNQNKTISRDELLTKVWGYDQSMNSRTVDNFIVRLRHKLEHDPSHPRYILTIHGVGYKFVVP